VSGTAEREEQVLETRRLPVGGKPTRQPTTNQPSSIRPPAPQEEIIPFFQSLQLSKDCTSVADCYLEISEKVGLWPGSFFFGGGGGGCPARRLDTPFLNARVSPTHTPPLPLLEILPEHISTPTRAPLHAPRPPKTGPRRPVPHRPLLHQAGRRDGGVDPVLAAAQRAQGARGGQVISSHRHGGARGRVMRGSAEAPGTAGRSGSMAACVWVRGSTLSLLSSSFSLSLSLSLSLR
jgi:hypothetical protein